MDSLSIVDVKFTAESDCVDRQIPDLMIFYKLQTINFISVVSMLNKKVL